jgi:hypothetical protein
MPRWGAERRARPLHEVPAASVLSAMRGRRKDARRIAFRCGSCTRLSALRLPSFKGGVFLATLFGLAFLGVGKARMRRRIATTKRLVIAGLDPLLVTTGLDPVVHGASQNALWSKLHSAIQHGPPGHLSPRRRFAPCARWRPGARAMRTLTSRAGAAATARSRGNRSPASAPRA